MQILTIPDVLLGDQMQDLNIIFYRRENGPDQVKLKLNYSQNMFCFMIEGKKELIDDQKRFMLDDQQIGLVSTGHMLMTERVTLKQELLLFFSNDFLSKFLLKYNINLSDNMESFVPVTAFPKDEYLLNFQKSMKLLQKDFGNPHFKTAKIEEVLLYLLEKYPDNAKAFISGVLKNVQNNALAGVINNHKYDNLSSEELAFLCNMSLSTFKRKFYDLFKTSPKKYVLEEKMKKAEQLLRHNKRPSEIYFQLGYENLSSFSLQFKKHFGIAPSLYFVQD